jgi:hypothetical protein
MRALLISMLLCVAPPAAINAAGGTPPGVNTATTPLNVNLLQNASFEQPAVGGSIPGWIVTGTVHVATFGTKPWPSPAYAAKYKGGNQYLVCGKVSGMVSQTVDLEGLSAGDFPLTARLSANIGGTKGHKVRVGIRATGGSGEVASKHKLRVLDITNHYKHAVTTLWLPQWTKHIEATVELLPKDGAAKCKVLADSIDLWVFQP